MIEADLLRELIAAASASPSVHNVQPARWRIEGEALVLLEDMSRRLSVGDPEGHDAAISLGASVEGLAIAASQHGLWAAVTMLNGDTSPLREVARITFTKGAKLDPLAPILGKRASWRGEFHAPTDEDRAAAKALEGPDRILLLRPKRIRALASFYDMASLGFMRNAAFRKELVSWMRLKPSHKDWSRDGLNAEAMGLSRMEAMGAKIVLGRLFKPLDLFGFSDRLLGEKDSFENAVGVVLFHRPSDEDPFESGRHFHRLWLEIDALGLGANVLAAVADDPEISASVSSSVRIPQGRRLVSAFRFGKRDGERFAPARLPLDELIVD